MYTCSPQPCQNGGKRIDGTASFTCECIDCFTGDTCQTNIDDCGQEFCKNGGTCVDEINNFTCIVENCVVLFCQESETPCQLCVVDGYTLYQANCSKHSCCGIIVSVLTYIIFVNCYYLQTTLTLGGNLRRLYRIPGNFYVVL